MVENVNDMASSLELFGECVMDIRGNCTKLTYHSADLFMEGVTFQADIQNMNNIADCITEDEICCEKLFVLLKSRRDELLQAALYYMYDICESPSIVSLLEEKYDLTKKYMVKISAKSMKKEDEQE